MRGFLLIPRSFHFENFVPRSGFRFECLSILDSLLCLYLPTPIQPGIIERHSW